MGDQLNLLSVSKAAKLLSQTRNTLQERERCLVVGIDPSTYNSVITSNLATLSSHLQSLKAQLNSIETDSSYSEEQVRKEEDKVIRFSKALDDITYQFNDGKISPDSPILDPTASPSQVSLSLKPLRASSHKPSVSEIVSPSDNESPLSPYSHLANSQILEMQRQTFEDQDRNLDMLSQSLGRQREIGVIIGQELEQHVMLLDETSNAVDMTEARLNQAQSRLYRIDRKSKQCKLCGALVVLFIVLLILLAIIRFFRL